MALRIRVFKKLDNNIPTDEFSYSRGTDGNDGKSTPSNPVLDPIYFSVLVIPATATQETFAPDPNGRTVYVLLEGDERAVDLKVSIAPIGENNPPSLVLDNFEVFNPNTNMWESGYNRWVTVSQEGEVINPNTVIPVRLRFHADANDTGDPVGLWEFFVKFLAYSIG